MIYQVRPPHKVYVPPHESPQLTLCPPAFVPPCVNGLGKTLTTHCLYNDLKIVESSQSANDMKIFILLCESHLKVRKIAVYRFLISFLVLELLRQVLFGIRAGNSNLAKSLSEKSNHAMYQDENPHRCLLSLQN